MLDGDCGRSEDTCGKGERGLYYIYDGEGKVKEGILVEILENLCRQNSISFRLKVLDGGKRTDVKYVTLKPGELVSVSKSRYDKHPGWNIYSLMP